MRTGRVLILAVLFLGAGLWVLFEFCEGTAGMNFGNSLAACRLTIDFTTVGVPAIVGIPLVGIGLLLLLIAFIAAIVSQFRRPKAVVREGVSAKRGVPFEG